MRSNILVIGGTGKTGRKIVSRLQNLDHHVRVGSRSAAIPFDWQDQSTWERALDGIQKMYITFQPDLAVPGASDAIKALSQLAQKNGIEKMVLLSGKGEKEAEKCEQIIKQSGSDYTIIRASWFNQNFSESFFLDPILAGHVALPKSDALVPYVDTDDIADVAVEALLNDQHNGETYELTGPRLLTFPQVIDEISKATGRKIQYTPVTLEAYIAAMHEQQVPEDYIWLIGYLFKEVLGIEINSVVTNDIEKILGRKAKDFSTYVAETVQTGVWNPVIPEFL